MEETNNFFLQQHPFNMIFAKRGSNREPLFRVLKLPVCTYESFARMMPVFRPLRDLMLLAQFGYSSS
jgi:hypothetical protein